LIGLLPQPEPEPEPEPDFFTIAVSIATIRKRTARAACDYIGKNEQLNRGLVDVETLVFDVAP
jgi:hypothetical protein